MVKNLAANIGDAGSIPGSGKSSGGGDGNLLPVLLPGKFHGPRSLVGYSPWDRKESNTPEQLNTQYPLLQSIKPCFARIGPGGS